MSVGSINNETTKNMRYNTLIVCLTLSHGEGRLRCSAIAPSPDGLISSDKVYCIKNRHNVSECRFSFRLQERLGDPHW